MTAIEPTWYSRELPVLKAIVYYFEEHGGMSFPQVRDIAQITGLEAEAVYRSCRALADEFITFRMVMAGGDPNPHTITAITANARRAVGQWPSAEAWADKIANGLADAASAEPDEGKRSKLRSAADALSGFGRDVLVEVLASGITKTSGL